MPHEPSAQVRAYADGLKLALHELAEEEPETLRRFILASFGHVADASNKWIGAKIVAIISGALIALAMWLISKVH